MTGTLHSVHLYDIDDSHNRLMNISISCTSVFPVQ